MRAPCTRVRLFSIYTTKLSLILLLGHLGLQLQKSGLTVGYLDVEYTFYAFSHKHNYRWSCMHVKFHAVALFIVNACQVGGHTKLLVSL
jgi:hypothetical protein